MAKKVFNRWFGDRVAESRRMCRIGSILLVPAALLAAFLTYWIVWLLILLGFGVLFDLSGTMVHVLAGLFMVALFAWQYTAGRDFEETYHFAGEGLSTIELNVAQMTGNSWVGLLEPGVASGLVRVVSLLFLTSPRLLGLSVMLHNRGERLQRMDTGGCARVMSFLMQAQGRVPFENIEQAFPDSDLTEIVQPLADVDGIVFLTKDGPAVTLAPRVVDEYKAWSAQQREEQ